MGLGCGFQKACAAGAYLRVLGVRAPDRFLLTIVAFGDDQGREFETQEYLTTKAANVFDYYKSCQLYNDEKPCRAEAVDRMKANGIEPTFWRRKNGSGQSCGCSCETH